MGANKEIHNAMQCKDTKELLDDYMADELQQQQRIVVESHLSVCEHCRQQLQQKQWLLSQLQTLPAPKPSRQLANRIVKQRRQKQAQKWRWFSAGVGSALAAGLVVFVFIVTLGNLNKQVETSAAVLVGINQASDVHILVQSGHDLENVRFSLLMPDNLELKGFKGRRELAWRGQLQQGANLLSLPLVPLTATHGTVVVRIEHQNVSKEYRVDISVNAG